MRVNTQRHATTVLVVLAVLLGTLWAGAPGASGAGGPADQLRAGRSRLGVEAAVPPGRAPALRPPAERADLGGRMVALLLGMLVTALAAASGTWAGRARPTVARARSRGGCPRLDARAPPSLQTA
jgi:hypothetical protein